MSIFGSSKKNQQQVLKSYNQHRYCTTTNIVFPTEHDEKKGVEQK